MSCTRAPFPYMQSSRREPQTVTFDPDGPEGLTSLFRLLRTGNSENIPFLINFPKYEFIKKRCLRTLAVAIEFSCSL